MKHHTIHTSTSTVLQNNLQYRTWPTHDKIFLLQTGKLAADTGSESFKWPMEKEEKKYCAEVYIHKLNDTDITKISILVYHYHSK
jgi:hypothetical protein